MHEPAKASYFFVSNECIVQTNINGRQIYYKETRANMHIPKSRILVVDDEPINLEITCNILQDEYDISVATNGNHAVAAARHLHPDLILLDVVMPEMDGYETCGQLRNDPSTNRIPVIFVTNQIALEQEIKGFESGAIDYVTRPLRPPILLARVRAHIGNRTSSATLPTLRSGPGTELSARECEILLWVQSGKTNWEIAQIVGTSQDNVKYFIRKLMAKFTVHSRAQLAMRATELQLESNRRPPALSNVPGKMAG